MVIIVEISAGRRMAHWGLIEELYDQFDDNLGFTPQNSISIRKIKMLIELGGFIACDPREALTITIGIFAIPVPPETCGGIEFQETIEVTINGAVLDLRNKCLMVSFHPMTAKDKMILMGGSCRKKLLGS
jgi:hypothetical protein